MTFSLNIQLTISTFFNYYCFISFHCSSISRFYHACDKAKIYNSRNWYSMVCGVSAIKRCIRTCENQQKDLSFPVGQRERRSDKGRANNNSTNTPKRKICIIKGTRTSKFYIIFFVLATCGNMLAQHILLSWIFPVCRIHFPGYLIRSYSRFYDAQLKAAVKWNANTDASTTYLRAGILKAFFSC